MAVTALVVSRARTRRRILLDRLSSRLVVLGGIVIIASILAILLVIAAEVYPLFKTPTAALVGTYRPVAPGAAPAPGDSVGVDEYREIAYAIAGTGAVELYPLKGERALEAVPAPALGGATVTTVASVGKGLYVLGTSDGLVIPLGVTELETNKVIVGLIVCLFGIPVYYVWKKFHTRQALGST